ncbi:MAG: DUF3226 domain-containing protein, partial [Chloroflexota bacterium]
SEVQLFDFGGINELQFFLESISTARRSVELKAIGIIRDAELDKSAAINSVKSALNHVNFPIPNQPLDIEFSGRPVVSYLIIPHDKPTGCLEDALLASITDQNLMTCVDGFVDCVDPDNQRSNSDRAKIAVHSLIAASTTPSMTLGESAKAGLWNLESDSLQIMLEFIRNLVKAVPS